MGAAFLIAFASAPPKGMSAARNSFRYLSALVLTCNTARTILS